MAESTYPPIAVIGVSALFPGALDSRGFWKNIIEGNDLLSPIPESHWRLADYYDPKPGTPDKTYAQRGGFLPMIDFDPLSFGVPPNILPATDTAQLLALEVARRVLDDAAGGDFSHMDRERISVVLGVASATELVGHMSSRLQLPIFERVLRTAALPEDQVAELTARLASCYTPWQESTFPGLLGNVVAGRIANRLDLGGTNCVVDAACASSLAALEIAVNELYLGQSEVVITGGVDALNDILMFMCFSQTPALSPSGDCRPFSDQADGTMLGEGVGMVALKRLDRAERDGDRIYAVLRGVGTSSDGRSKSIYAPVSAGQAKAIKRCYEVAGYGPEDVELVEAHGTGTKAGDAAEFGGLNAIFQVEGAPQWCALGSVKSQIGHTKAAAGAGGLFKIVMALHHKVLPPTIKVDRPNPALKLEETAFYLNTETRPWVRPAGGHPRRASVSSFGFGGTNFHVALEEYTGPGPRAARSWVAPARLFALSEATPAALAARCRALAGELAGGDAALFDFLAVDLLERFAPGAGARVALVASDAAGLAAQLEGMARHMEASPGTALATPQGGHYSAAAPHAGKVAFLFPGQGSQYVGMGDQLAMTFDDARDTWDAVAALDGPLGQLHKVVYPLPVFSDEDRQAQEARLTRTEWAQPAIGAVSLGMLRLLRRLGLEPDMVGGHSYGELVALYAAGVFKDEAALMEASRTRGALMAEASASAAGAMCAVVSAIEPLQASLAAWAIPGVVVANHNHPTQVVLSGTVEGIAAVEARLAAANLSFTRLKVSTAFHSPLVSASAAPFEAALAALEFAAPRIPVYANSTAAPYPSEPAAQRRLLAGQLAQSVRFVEQVQAMRQGGATLFIEVGPHSVLGGLATRCLQGAGAQVVSLDQRGRHGVTSLLQGLAALAAAGAPLQLGALNDGFERLADPRTHKKATFTVKIHGANYGKPSAPTEIHPLRSMTMTSHTTPPAPPTLAPAPTAAPAAAPAPVAAAAPQPPAPVAYIPYGDGRMYAFERLHERTVQAHQSFQHLMTESHIAFLDVARAAFQSLSGQPVDSAAPAPRPSYAPPSYAPAPSYAPPAPTYAPPAYAAPAPQAALPAPPPVAYAPPAPVAPPVAYAAPVPAPAPAPAPVAAAPAAAPAPAPAAPAAAAPAVDLVAIMLAVVSEKTGYPTEMLNLEMELEADLGIDSIKRVEILSGMQEQVPSLPEVETGKMASMVTLQQIVDYMGGLLGNA